jgi:TonB family protein
MNTQLLGLTAAALLLAASASPAAATPTDSQRYADRLQAKTEALLLAAGVDAQSPPVSVRAQVRPDGHLTTVQVLHTSGSPQLDRTVAEVLRKVLVTDAPVGLLDGAVTLNVGRGAIRQADAR